MAVSYYNGTADHTVLTGTGNLLSVHLTAGSGADATLAVYDNTSASSPMVYTLAAKAGESSDFSPKRKLSITTGIYADVTGAGANYTVVYES